jgi:hypothetical protein
MKHYSNAVEESTTDVNGAWKPLKPLSEGFEFIGDDQYDNFLTRKGKERRDLRQQGRESGLSRKDARKSAKLQVPTSKPARREAYLTLVKLNFRGFAWKLNSIITGTNTKLLNDLKERWRKFGDWNELVDAVNKGKDKNPLICGGKCRKEILDTQVSNFVIAGVTISTSTLVALAGSIITALASITKQGQIGKQQREALESAEKIAQMEFDQISPEEKKAIIDAENQLRREIQNTDTKKYIWIGVGVFAVLAIGYLVIKNKK